jgi:hypothetical protein
MEELRGVLKQVNTDYQTLALESEHPSQTSVHKYRLPLASSEFRALLGKRVRCVVEDKVVVSMVEA